SLHSQAKVIVYETLYLLEMPKSRFKKVAASLCTFLCISLHFLLAQNTLSTIRYLIGYKKVSNRYHSEVPFLLY
ncbi:hypothetical protein, partial [Bacillus mycoides]|uniref:hypothetical protein n=1 Tax=Bacillus mycoides TaxID=1405 RepID=UPI003D1A44B9